MPQPSATKGPKRIAYIGKDQLYWKELQKKFQYLYPEVSFTFLVLFEKRASLVKTLLHKVALLNVEVVFVDYTLFPDETLRLALSLRREISTSHILVIGLLDNLKSKELLVKSLSLGIYLNIVKSIEYTAVVHHVFSIAYRPGAKDANFVVAKIKFKTKAVTFFKMGYLTDKYIHLESDFPFEVGEEIDIQVKLSSDLSCERFRVNAKGERNIYSHFRYWYTLSYDFSFNERLPLLQEKIKKLGEEKEKTKTDTKSIDFEISAIVAEWDGLSKKMKRQEKLILPLVTEWIEKNQENSRPKRTTVLVIDRGMNLLYQSKEELDNYPFSIRYQTVADPQWEIILRTMPGIIILNLEYPEGVSSFLPPKAISEEQKEKVFDDGWQEGFNNLKAIKDMLAQIKQIPKYNPIILIFNCREDSELMMREFRYARLMYRIDPLDLSSLQQMADLYTKKGGRTLTHNPDLSTAHKEKRVYLSKYDLASIAEFSIHIEVINISETDLVFITKQKIPMYTSFYIKVPVKMTVTVVPSKPKNPLKENYYYGLISGLGEGEKRDLRMYINKLIFSDVEDKQQKEIQQFLDLNKKELEKKMMKEDKV